MYEWSNKAVLITGGAQGIGAAIVKLVLDEGAKYIAIFDVATAEAKALQDDLNTKCGKQVVHFHQCDVSVEEQIETAFRAVVEECGYIDVVINNAGICNEKGLMFRKEIDINYTGVVSITLKALELMRKDEGGKGGAIISISSLAAVRKMPLYPIYSGTKAAVLMFTLTLGMKEYYERTGVRTITICLGRTDTPILNNCVVFDKLYNEKFNEIIRGHPIQSAEAAAQGVSEAYKNGESGSTWTVEHGNTKNITEAVDKTFQVVADAQ